ncbi:39S ribosomal protein L10, mitochondrial [Octopus bimaculoides]|uniref:Large ribosomal subunit protein uL10m n=1 Tax=Octopus bimaculoides TaxID=37653 RepID=A0A0L8HXR5_OCTBM|nr:39S ribosomal protein L10, mitochondrial [Octopus bimaculoides]|eukprot:XP_014768527.1 PREDICTED: 39S ribosomal protein L10, mitochondrial-like [Octopus bimaculoides]
MAALCNVRNKIFQPLFSQVRHRKSFDVRKPPPPSVIHRLIKEVTAPLEVYRPMPMADQCYIGKLTQYASNKQLNRYEEFMLEQVRKRLKSQRLLLIYHHLPMTAAEKKTMQYQISTQGFKLFYANTKLMKTALAETRWANLCQSITQFTCFISSESLKVSDLLKCTHSMAKLILLGGAIENHLLTRDGVVAFSKLSLENVQSQLVGLLASNSATASSLLDHHQRQLVANLKQLSIQDSQD